MILMIAVPAQAGGLYISGSAGVSLADDSDVTGTGIDTSLDFDPGTVATLATGYAFDNGFRGELELASRWNDAETVGGSTGTGDTRAISGMLNVLYDINPDHAITPYIGAGLGAVQIKDSGIASINGSSISDDDTVFAYQAMAGVSYDVNALWSLTADYRYFASDDASLTTASSVAVEQDYTSHSILIGIRFNLDSVANTMPQTGNDEPIVSHASSAATAPVASVPAPDAVTAEAPVEPDTADETQMAASTEAATSLAPATDFPRSYRILFDWDKKALNPLALNTIAAIAMNAHEGEVIRIRAIGHADRSGTEAYNETLSRARAEEVQQTLIRLGIPADRIAIDWRGETDPAVETADGVRELQNRRVEIVFPAN